MVQRKGLQGKELKRRGDTGEGRLAGRGSLCPSSSRPPPRRKGGGRVRSYNFSKEAKVLVFHETVLDL